MYADDNSSYLPSAAINYGGGDEAPLGWFVEISPYIYNKNTNWDTSVQSNSISAQNTVVACPAAKLTDAVLVTMPGYPGYGGYGHNYDFLGYDVTIDPHFKLSEITKPVTCCMNGDALDPAPGLQAWNYGYLYPPTQPPDGSTGFYPYTRHGDGTGGDYAWADGHVSMTTWKIMSKGQSGYIDWYYMPTPTSQPSY